MAILVDEAKFQRGNQMWCHMMSDLANQKEAVAELHVFAQQIGLKRNWYQAKSSPHYDLSPYYRKRAIQAGAEAVTSQELVKRCIKIHRPKCDVHEWRDITPYRSVCVRCGEVKTWQEADSGGAK